jgi:hypothetical protein
MADIKNFGIKGLAADVQMGKSGGRLKYDAANNRFDFTQSNGSTLEDVRFGSVVAGDWTGTAIGTQYGGTGQDFSSSTGLVLFDNGTASSGTLDLSNASFVSGIVAVENGGTGANTASAARTNLELGSIATQDANNVTLSGGTINDIIIGGTTTAAGSFTTLAASSGITGELTGNASGNAGTATALETARNFSASGDATATAVSFNGSDDVDLVLTLANSGVAAGTYGDATNIPQFTVDAKGLVTAVSNIAIATNFTIAGDSGNADVVNGGETLTVVGASGQIETTISNNEIEIAIVDGASIANLTVTGTFTSDDITSSQISIDGDAIITGNLTVQGTQTIVESTTVQTADAIFRTNSNGSNTDAGFEANTANGVKQILYTAVGQEWDFGSENVKADTFEGELTGNVTGQVSDISNHDTGDLTEGSNLYYTTARANSAMDAYLVGGVGLTYTSGTIDLDNTAVAAGVYGDATNIPQFTVDAQGRVTAASNIAISTQFTLAGDTGNSVISGGDTATVTGGTNITTSVSSDTVTIDLDDNVLLNGNLSAVNVTGSGAVQGATLTDGTLSISAGDITGAVDGTFTGTLSASNLTDGAIDISNGSITGGVAATFSGAVTGGSFTDGTATLTGGALSGATTGAFSGNVSAGNLSTSGAVTAGNADVSGTLAFGSLTDGSITITGFVDEDNMASDSNVLIPTQQSVKAYIDAQLTAAALGIAGDTGSDSVDLDSETLTIAGGTGLSSSVSGQTVTIDLDDTAVTSGSYGAAGSVATFTVDAQGRLTAASNVTIDITASQVNDFTAAVDAHLSGGTGITYTAGTIDLDDTTVAAGTYGDSTNIPQFTVDAQGRITAASNIAISTNFSIAGDSGNTDVVNGGETLTVIGTTGQIETTITNNSIEVGIVDGASIANLTVTGTFTSDDITSSQISIDGDAIITGNLTVQGTQTIVESTTVQTADAIFRTNSNGSATDAGFEANTASGVKQILYTTVGGEWDFGSENVKADTFTGDLVGNADSATALETARDFSASGDATASAVSFDGTGNVDLALTLATVNSDVGTYGNATLIPSITVNAKGLVTGVTTNAVASDLSISGDSGSDSVSLLNDTLSFSGGNNITSTVTDNDVEFDLDANITLTSVTADTFTGDLTGNVTASGAVEFGSLTDGTVSITDFVTEATGLGASDNDTSVPTTAAVIDYIANNAGDGLLLRGTFTADSANSSFEVGTVPNVSGRTYYADKIVIKVGTAFSGGSFNHILVKENGGSGSTLVAADDADAATQGTYIIELTGDETLTKNASVEVEFLQSDGSTPAVTTSGSMTATVHYKYV